MKSIRLVLGMVVLSLGQFSLPNDEDYDQGFKVVWCQADVPGRYCTEFTEYDPIKVCKHWWKVQCDDYQILTEQTQFINDHDGFSLWQPEIGWQCRRSKQYPNYVVFRSASGNVNSLVELPHLYNFLQEQEHRLVPQLFNDL